VNAAQFHNIYRSLIEENPVAIRAVLKILTIEYTDRVPTMSITCEARPTLLVNLSFVAEHCRTDSEVAAVIVHEFLHVLLRHTHRLEPVTLEENIACDAVINAIIHRTMGPEASSFMKRYYAPETEMNRLLRPPRDHCNVGTSAWRHERKREKRFLQIWRALYLGDLLVDDIRAFIGDLNGAEAPIGHLLGNHDPALSREGDAGPAAQILVEALRESLTQLDAATIYRTPAKGAAGIGSAIAGLHIAASATKLWLAETEAVLRRHLLADASGAPAPCPATGLLPVLSPSDARASMRAQWSPFLPEAAWPTERRVPAGRALVYLDASGSMDEELPLLVLLLARLSAHIRRPFWAFSTVISPAHIENGRLSTTSTGGTQLSCVLEHVAQHKPRAAVVITDGFIETVNPKLLQATRGTRLHALVTRRGTTLPFTRLGIPFTHLREVPK
jgi:hypothetical protein